MKSKIILITSLIAASLLNSCNEKKKDNVEPSISKSEFMFIYNNTTYTGVPEINEIANANGYTVIDSKITTYKGVREEDDKFINLRLCFTSKPLATKEYMAAFENPYLNFTLLDNTEIGIILSLKEQFYDEWRSNEKFENKVKVVKVSNGIQTKLDNITMVYYGIPDSPDIFTISGFVNMKY